MLTLLRLLRMLAVRLSPRAVTRIGNGLDQFASAEQVWVDFFGRPASTLPAPAVLTQRTGAPVVPLFTHRQADGTHAIEIHPALPFEECGDRDLTIEHNTQQYTAVIEAAIRRHPEQWTWIHRRRKAPDLAPRRPEVPTATESDD